MDGQHIGEAIVGALVVVKHVTDWLGTKSREKRRRDEFDEFRQDLRAEIAAQLAGFDKRIEKLFAFVIGPDGENGIRGDQRELKRRVDDMEERERDRERATLNRPMYDRRSGT